MMRREQTVSMRKLDLHLMKEIVFEKVFEMALFFFACMKIYVQ